VLDESETEDALRHRLERYAWNFSTGVEWRYAMTTRGDRATPVGGCGLHPRVGAGAIEIGYWVATAATGQGFATEAAAALTDEAFRMGDIARIEIRCDPANEASIAVPRRLGYRARAEIVHEIAGQGRPGGDVVVWDLTRGSRAATDR
jgi:RimJ/RimL family protein N-acetyltransferase